MRLGISTLLGSSLNGRDVGGRGVGRVLGNDIPTGEATTLVGNTVDCLGGATEFTVLLGNADVRVSSMGLNEQNLPRLRNRLGQNRER